MKQESNIDNPELEQLGTHAAGSVDLHETRHTSTPVQVDAPVVPTPGPIDTRDDKFDSQNSAQEE